MWRGSRSCRQSSSIEALVTSNEAFSGAEQETLAGVQGTMDMGNASWLPDPVSPTPGLGGADAALVTRRPHRGRPGASLSDRGQARRGACDIGSKEGCYTPRVGDQTLVEARVPACGRFSESGRRLLAGEVFRLTDASGALVFRHLGIWTERPRSDGVALCVDLGGNDHFGRHAILHPAHERFQRVCHLSAVQSVSKQEGQIRRKLSRGFCGQKLCQELIVIA